MARSNEMDEVSFSTNRLVAKANTYEHSLFGRDS
jgi:hypothetical protein